MRFTLDSIFKFSGKRKRKVPGQGFKDILEPFWGQGHHFGIYGAAWGPGDGNRKGLEAHAPEMVTASAWERMPR